MSNLKGTSAMIGLLKNICSHPDAHASRSGCHGHRAEIEYSTQDIFLLISLKMAV
jgi:hypothetical protein